MTTWFNIANLYDDDDEWDIVDNLEDDGGWDDMLQEEDDDWEEDDDMPNLDKRTLSYTDKYNLD